MKKKKSRGPSRNYPVALPLRFAASSKFRQFSGTGKTLLMGSREVYFTANCALDVGMEIEVSVAWPAGLDDGVRLQLFLSGLIVAINGRWTQVRVDHHDFRTRGHWQESDRPRLEAVYAAGAGLASA